MRGEKAIAELAAPHHVHPNQVTTWKAQLVEDAAGVSCGAPMAEDSKAQIKDLHEKIGQLTMERDVLDSTLEKFAGLSGKR